MLQPGTKLRMSNLHVNNFAVKAAYEYSARAPYLSVGVGMGLWPTFISGPNTTVGALTERGCQANAEVHRLAACERTSADSNQAVAYRYRTAHLAIATARPSKAWVNV